MWRHYYLIDTIVLFFSGKIWIDYFSLDVEGAELAILKTIPWEKVDIKYVNVFLEQGDH